MASYFTNQENGCWFIFYISSLCRGIKLALLSLSIVFVTSVNSIASQKNDNKAFILQVVTEEYWPYAYRKDGKIVGSSTNLIHKVLQHANIDYEIKIYTWARAYKKSLEQKNTLIYVIYRTPEREDKFHWIGKIFEGDIIDFYAKSDATIKAREITDLKKFRFITQKNSASAHFLEKYQFKSIRYVATFKQCVGMLLKGRGDLILANKKYLVDQMTLLKASPMSVKRIYSGYTVSGYFALSQDSDPELVEKLTNSYSELLAKGEISY